MRRVRGSRRVVVARTVVENLNLVGFARSLGRVGRLVGPLARVAVVVARVVPSGLVVRVRLRLVVVRPLAVVAVVVLGVPDDDGVLAVGVALDRRVGLGVGDSRLRATGLGLRGGLVAGVVEDDGVRGVGPPTSSSSSPSSVGVAANSSVAASLSSLSAPPSWSSGASASSLPCSRRRRGTRRSGNRSPSR
ncbi:hypothetical protein ACFQL4_19135 [Halosimplex aquaticum]